MQSTHVCLLARCRYACSEACRCTHERRCQGNAGRPAAMWMRCRLCGRHSCCRHSRLLRIIVNGLCSWQRPGSTTPDSRPPYIWALLAGDHHMEALLLVQHSSGRHHGLAQQLACCACRGAEATAQHACTARWPISPVVRPTPVARVLELHADPQT